MRAASEAQSEGLKDWRAMFAIWLTATLANLFKPFTIDDTAYLEMARWISAHPLHPMSGPLNWEGVLEPMYKVTQPALYPYMLAGWGKLFGYSEPAMHSLQALFALACVWLVYRLARSFTTHPVWITAMIILGPAFLVEQNLMVDVPLMAAWLAFFNCLIVDYASPRQTRRFVLAGVALGAALLIKYSSLALLPIFGVALLYERRWRQAFAFFIPLAALALWSGFNYYDFHGIHLLQPASLPPTHRRLVRFPLEWVAYIGGLSTLGIVILIQSRRALASRSRLIYPALAAAFVVLVLMVATRHLSDLRSDAILRVSFAINGLLLVLPTFLAAVWWIRGRGWAIEHAPRLHGTTYLLLWFFSVSIFYVTAAPFVASRHVLTILTPVTLFAVDRARFEMTAFARSFALLTMVILSAGIAVSDFRFASYFRDEALGARSSLHTDRPIWALGHWGWQWYATQAGLLQVDIRTVRFAPGDFLIVPHDTYYNYPWVPLMLTNVREDTQADPLLSIFCTTRGTRFYASSQYGPWSLSSNCLNHVGIYRITSNPAEAIVPPWVNGR